MAGIRCSGNRPRKSLGYVRSGRLPILRRARAEPEGVWTGSGGNPLKMAKRLWRLFWLVVLVGHGLVALVWWGLSPGGFRLDHPRFWTNRAAPPVVLALSIASLVALRQERIAPLGGSCRHWPAAWAAGAIMLRIMFPITMDRLWLVPLVGRGRDGDRRGPSLARSRRAGMDRGLWQSHPPSPVRPRVAALRPPAVPRNPYAAGERPMVQTHDGSLMVRIAPLSISIQPFLTFLACRRPSKPPAESPTDPCRSEYNLPQRFPGRIAPSPWRETASRKRVDRPGRRDAIGTAGPIAS